MTCWSSGQQYTNFLDAKLACNKEGSCYGIRRNIYDFGIKLCFYPNINEHTSKEIATDTEIKKNKFGEKFLLPCNNKN